MAPPSGRFRPARRRSRSPPGLSSRSLPSNRHGPPHFKYNVGPTEVRPKFREQPTFNGRRDFAVHRNSLNQDERGPNSTGSYMSRYRGPIIDRPSFDSNDRRPPCVNYPQRHFNRNNNQQTTFNNFREYNGSRGSIRERVRDNPVDRYRKFQDRGVQESYRNDVRHHYDNNQSMRDDHRGNRSPQGRDHWRSANVPTRRSPPRHRPPQINSLPPTTRYERPFVNDNRSKGGHRGGRNFRSGRGTFRSTNRSLPSRR